MGKTIAAQISRFFEDEKEKWPGMQFEFHIRGHHTKKGSKERTQVWYERYIILTLPPVDYVPRSKRMSFRPAVLKQMEEEKEKADAAQAKVPSKIIQEDQREYIT